MTVKREMKGRVVAGAAALGLLLVLGLWPSGSCKPGQSAGAPGRSPTPVTLGIGVEPLAAPVILAESEGFFARRGVAASVRRFASGKLAMAAMLAGETQMATAAETPMVFESFNRRDFRVLAIIASSDNEGRIVVRQDRGIRAPGDLKGRRIVTQGASAMHFFLHMFLIKHGLSEKDVTIIFAPTDTFAEQLLDGRADACCAREPLISRAVAALGDKAAVFEAPGLFVKYYLLVTTQRFLQENPGAARAVLRALADAEVFAKAHPRQATGAVARTFQIAVPVVERLWPSLDLRLRLSQSLLLAMEDEARWTLSGRLVREAAMPNYLQFVHLDAMLSVKPSAVSIIR